MTTPRYSVCMIFAFDPRGDRIGGIETFVRDYIDYLPADFRLLLVGIDQRGDLELGKAVTLTLRGTTFDFMPVLHSDPALDNVYAKRLSQSLTLRFLLALMRHGRAIRRYVQAHGSTLELRRMEHFPIRFLVSAPYVQMLHDGKTRESQMSSLLKKYWWINRLSERLSLTFAARFFCVNDQLTARLQAQFPKHSAKIDTLTTWANPRLFRPTAFAPADGRLHVVYAGRLDAFKRPDIMFSVIARLAQIAPVPVCFHYIGDGDPETFAEFAAIRPITLREGKCSATEVRDIYARAAVGLLTSDFEGMPRMVMELLAVGRPVVALHLPQLEQVIREGQSGMLVTRGAEQINTMAEALLAMWQKTDSGALRAEAVSQAVAAYQPQALLEKLFATHRSLQNKPR